MVGYGRAEKSQVQQMVKLLLGLTAVPSPHDAADALAVAICHVHAQPPARRGGRIAAARSAEVGDELAPLPAVIAHLRGRILEKQPTRVVVDVGGVGYDVAVPLSTFYGLGEAGRRGRAARAYARARGCAGAATRFATRSNSICSSA